MIVVGGGDDEAREDSVAVIVIVVVVAADVVVVVDVDSSSQCDCNFDDNTFVYFDYIMSLFIWRFQCIYSCCCFVVELVFQCTHYNISYISLFV